MNRFYKTAEAVACKIEGQREPFYEIHLDGRAVKTPARKSLSVKSKRLADQIAAEWLAQVDQIIPQTMPLMQIVTTCIDHVSQHREAMTDQLLKYIDTDLLFYRAETPKALAVKQAQMWDGILAVYQEESDISLQTTYGLDVLNQPAAHHKGVEDYIRALSDEAFTVLQIVTPISGSIIMGVLFTQGALTPEQTLSAARVEERYKDGLYNAEKYGQDPVIEKADKQALTDLEACSVYLSHIG